ncbi:MAG: hypothetical protein M3Q65_01490 [Chloroflexota bacterium]|nr:hypothetical protein [Chloroflexota bacterium]
MGRARRHRAIMPVAVSVELVPADPPIPKPAPDTRPAPLREADAAGFAAIMGLAREIAGREPAALVDLVALLGKKIQADIINRFLAHPAPDPADLEPAPEHLWFDPRLPLTPTGATLNDLLIRLPRKPRVALRTAVVLPWPWACGRFVNALCSIGPGRRWGPWQEDRQNHFLECWLPLGLCWVGGGNHSLTAGIAQGRGTVRVEVLRDLTPVYDHVVCDGTSFMRHHDGEVLGPVQSVQAAALFEIGRLMVAHGVSAV